jgi:hypothetical protein
MKCSRLRKKVWRFNYRNEKLNSYKIDENLLRVYKGVCV